MPQLSPFQQIHENKAAAMAERDGWLMPLHYGDPLDEYRRCRENLAVFDSSYSYRIRVGGPDAQKLLGPLVSCDVTRIFPNRQRYALFCNEQGGIIEDCLIQNQGSGYLLIGNPANHQRILNYLQSRQPSLNAKITDETFTTAMVTLRGPYALPLLKEKLPFDLETLQPGDVLAENYFFMRFVISLDESLSPSIILPAKMASMAWDMLEKYGKIYNAGVAGLETRNSLRIEAGQPGFGSELNESIDPWTAGLQHAVVLAGDFIGAPALRRLAEGNHTPKIAGFLLDAHPECPLNLPAPIIMADRQAGQITSSCFSPAMQKPIALGYLNPNLPPNPTLHLKTTSANIPLTLTPIPFLSR